ncbi:NAD(P)-binding protein [Collinsella sp. zg1085]|uniref:UDP-galactopyranose mutase n=1 Tax=Collinsella sp. zg1085 TaxID=2844380 RepID=UPI001C0CA008|nr:UDP-galactopyranose mutase [Collinsella sp. zg1085]QWT18007.1 NAD(P)-binding protein [Collinsella sp. zg1085]
MAISSGIPRGFNPHYYDMVVVGAGCAGSVCARRIAEVLGFHIAVFERQGHVAGLAYDYLRDDGSLIQPYGSRVYQSKSERVFSFLSRFTSWCKSKQSAAEETRQPYQPKNGYTALFERMLNHDLIDVFCNVDACQLVSIHETYTSLLGQPFGGELVYTGALDELFAFDEGKLYFESTLEHAFYTKLESNSRDLYNRYLERVGDIINFHPVGRLAEYCYYDMDAEIESALELSDELITCHVK